MAARMTLLLQPGRESFPAEWALELAGKSSCKQQGWVTRLFPLTGQQEALCWAGVGSLALSERRSHTDTHTDTHAHLTSMHTHTENSNTPTLTPAREEIANAIAESKQ